MNFTKISKEQKQQFRVSGKSMVFHATAYINDYETELTVIATLDCVIFAYEKYDVNFDVFLEFIKSANSVLEAKQIAEETFKTHMTSVEFKRLGFEDIS